MMRKQKVEVKNTIRVERAIKNISQGELADEVGISRQTIHLIETCRVDPRLETAKRIAKYFGRKIGEIFKLND